MKKILVIILIILLSSCTHIEGQLEDTEINENEVTAVSDEELNAVFGEFDDEYYEAIGAKGKEEKDITQKILWDENTKFTYCDSLSNYDNIEFYYKADDIILLEKAIENITYSTNYNITYNFPKKINEFCKTSDSKKYILWGTTKYNTIILGKYDKDLDVFEVIKFKGNFKEHYMDKGGSISGRSYGNTSLEEYYHEYIESKKSIIGFGIKNKKTIPFANYGVSITGHAESAPGIFADILHLFDKNSRDYCEGGLTPEGNLSVCFVDIFYDIDLIENEITDSRVCSYYIDDGGEIKTLEKCFDYNENYKGYNLKHKAKGIDIYQDDSGNLSVLNIDLNSTNISFGGVNTTYKKVKGEVFEGYTDEDGVIQIPPSYDTKIISEIEYENQDSELYRFNRYKASEFPNTIKFEYRREYNTNAVINGQFFDQNKNPTFLSFPLKSDGKIINSHIDNEIPKRTFVIDVEGNAKILEGYKNSYLENKNYKELIVGFTPEVDAQKKSKIGRTYIGINNSKNIIFFVAKDKTQDEMNKIISDYGIKEENIIMMDGGPSSQFAYFDRRGPGSVFKEFYGEWAVPHYFMIYTD